MELRKMYVAELSRLMKLRKGNVLIFALTALLTIAVYG
jgi:hypothetical protein